MPLASYTPKSHTIPLGDDNSFNVTGLSLTHLTIIVETHLEDAEALWDLFSQGGDFTDDDLKRLGLSLATNAPGFVANMIALASGEVNAQLGAARLPFPIQLEATAKIMELTFSEVGGIKKFMETVAGLLSSLKMQRPTALTETPMTTNPP